MIPKILSPLDKVEEINDLIETGANELYCGVIDEEWIRKYPIAGFNRRVEISANLKSFSDLRSAVDIAHSYNASIALTINEHYYTDVQYPYVLRYAAKAIDAGVDAFIVADLALILALREEGIEIPLHLSTGGTVFNSETAKFYQAAGVSRVTIPRHLTLGEIARMVREMPELETSVFVLNSRCANIDGFCTFDHAPFKCPDPAKFLDPDKVNEFPEQVFSKDIVATGCCNLPYIVEPDEPNHPVSRGGCEREKAEAALSKQKLWDRHHIDDIPCGACALYDFHQMGITSVKIVGRGNPTRRKIGDIGFIRMLLALLEDETISRDDFMRHARDLRRANYEQTCATINCYYPEVLVREKGKFSHEDSSS